MPLTNPPDITNDDEEFIQLKDFMGKTLVALPLEKDTIDTTFGRSDIIRADFWEWSDKTESLVDLGTLTVFWVKLRRQLESSVGTGNAIVGTLMPAGRSFMLVDLEPALLEKVGAAWDALEAF